MRLEIAARSEGTTPVGWIEQRLPPEPVLCMEKEADSSKPKNMLEVFGDLVGSVHSGGKDELAERHSEVFLECLEQRRREGRL
jgi:hypothetical protein